MMKINFFFLSPLLFLFSVKKYVALFEEFMEDLPHQSERDKAQSESATQQNSRSQVTQRKRQRKRQV